MPVQIAELKAKELKPSLFEMSGISRRTVEEHYKLYQGYVNKHNEIVKKLASVDLSTANQTYSDIRELKVELTFALGGVKNHEIYFEHLGGNGGKPSGRLLELIERDFGSYDAWAADLKATGIAARGWVWLAFDHDYGYLFNYLGDAQNTFPVWNATPILALDTYEHAYFIDFGTNRAAYIDAFFANLDWEPVARRLEAAERMYRALRQD
ncbi:MAG: superoxide dismutase [Armatimonadota bacterium]